MASHFDYYSPKDGARVTSREKYEVLHNSIEYDEDRWGYYGGTAVEKVPGYIHERTGLITTDIRKFEKWLKKVEGK